jgi:hypothetical protein
MQDFNMKQNVFVAGYKKQTFQRSNYLFELGNRSVQSLAQPQQHIKNTSP